MEKQLELFPQDWEYDFSNPPRIMPPKCSFCTQCGDLVHNDDVVIKQFYTGTMTDVRYFCSDRCHHTWYVNRLRQWGL